MPPKKIVTNASTLIDLKAELVRKQQGVKNNQQTDAVVTRHTSSGAIFIGHKSNVLQKQAKAEKAKRLEDHRLKKLDNEEQQRQYNEAKAKLARKAALYDKLQSGQFEAHSSDEDESDGRYLVDFDRKRHRSDSSDDEIAAYQLSRLPEDMRSVYAPQPVRRDDDEDASTPQISTTTAPKATEEPTSSSDAVHYQHVSNDDARELGVGYYRFAPDETERAKQMQELNKLRQQTQSIREQEERIKQRRAQLMAERLAKVRANRGLPPEKPIDVESIPLPEETEKAAERERLEQQAKDAEEALNEMRRKRHVRPWDKGKNVIQDESVGRYSQSEWIKKHRSERNAEFAPPASYFK